MGEPNKRFFSILFRYTFSIFIALPNFYLFYLVFTPLTIYPVYFLLKIFFETSLSFQTIFINQLPIEIIDACVAGSAYYFLFVLNLSIPNVETTKRAKMILFAFSSFLIINLLRIFFLSLLVINNSSFFDIIHKFFWYFLSIIFVVGIWFVEVKIFKIKEVPFYTDLKFVYQNSILKKTKKTKSSKKN